MKRAFLILAAIGSLVTAANCGGTSSLDNRPCPCSDGYVCCETTSLCIAPGASCASKQPQEAGPGADAGGDAKDAAPVVCGDVPNDPPPGTPGPSTDGGVDEGGAPRCPTLEPVTAAQLDAELTWKPPAAPQNVCAQTDIDNLRAAFNQKGGSLTFTDLKSALGPTCAACAFSAQSGPTWQPFVDAQGGGTIDNSLSSCFTQVQGGACGPAYGAACGKARFRLDSCLNLVCSPTDCGGDVTACNAKALKGACKAFVSPYATACPGESTLLDTCGNVLSIIANSCSGGPGNAINTKL